MDYVFHFEIIPRNYEVFLYGAWLTIKLSFTATFFGLIIGIIGAMCKNYRIKPFDWLVSAYVELVRNTPFLIQLFFIFFGLANLKIRITAEHSALIALSANLGAYATEIIRAGIESIEKGKIEAGLSLGLSRLQVFRHIILLPALKVVYPALSSQFILIMLGSSIVSQISAEELTFSANFLQSRTFRSFEIYLTVTLIYLGLSVLFRGVFNSIHYAVFTRKSRN